MTLFLKVLEDLCNDPSVEKLDFYFGDAEYKNRYGTEHWQEANVCMFALRVYPMLVNVLQFTTMGMNTVLKYIANKTGFANRIKRMWRSLLSEKAEAGKNPFSAERVQNSNYYS